MNTSPTLVICCVLVIIGSGIVAAQVPRDTPDYQVTAERQENSKCHEMMVKQLYLATDITDPAQEKYLLAAEAYRQLDQAGQGCQ